VAKNNKGPWAAGDAAQEEIQREAVEMARQICMEMAMRKVPPNQMMNVYEHCWLMTFVFYAPPDTWLDQFDHKHVPSMRKMLKQIYRQERRKWEELQRASTQELVKATEDA
jgi:hypothetical protein